jgi:hypothetical protein
LSRETIRWKAAIQRNGGLGLSLGSDLLLFGNTSKDKGYRYDGVIGKVSDEPAFTRFLTKELPYLLDSVQVHMTVITENKGYHSLVIVNDGSQNPICIGFNSEAVVLLRAGRGISDPAFLNRELKRIFNLPKDSSLLANESFKHSEKFAADILFWHKGKNPFFQTTLITGKDSIKPDENFEARLNFNKGELVVEVISRSASHQTSKLFGKTESTGSFTRFVSKDHFMGLFFARVNISALVNDMERENHLTRLLDKYGLKLKDLEDGFDGTAEIAFNGFVHYPEKYIAYEYDENFNRVEVEKQRDAKIPGFILSLGLSGFEAKNTLLPKLLLNKQIIPWKNGYRFNTEAPLFVHLIGSKLFITSSETPPKEQGLGAVDRKDIVSLLKNHPGGCFVDLRTLEEQYRSTFNVPASRNRISDLFTSLTVYADNDPEYGSRSILTLKCADQETNALLQIWNSAFFSEFVSHPSSNP